MVDIKLLVSHFHPLEDEQFTPIDRDGKKLIIENDSENSLLFL